MNVGEKLKSRFESDAHCIGIDPPSKDHSGKTEKPAAKEAPVASFAHVDYGKLALLKPASAIASGTTKAIHAASVTLKDAGVKKDLGAAKVATLPLVTATGAVIADAAGAMGASIAVSLAVQSMAGAGVSGQEELTPLGAAAFACSEVTFLKQTNSLRQDLSKAMDAGRAAVPVVREAAHHLIEAFKHNLGR